MLYAREKRHRGAETFELAAALQAAGQVSLDLLTLVSIERLVEPCREQIARLGAGHGRKRSILSLRSMRAR
jgi:hypothetical protein